MRKSILFLLFLLVPVSTFANLNFTVTPIKYELNLTPGETITLPMGIRNNSTEEIIFGTQVGDFKPQGSDGTPDWINGTGEKDGESLSDWIRIKDSQVLSTPGGESETSFTIQIPENATPGGHYGGVFFRKDGANSENGGVINIEIEYGIIILVNIEGENTMNLDVKDPELYGPGIIPDSGNIEIKQNLSANIIGGSKTKIYPWYEGRDEQGNENYSYPDSCLLGDFTSSLYDNACYKNNINLEGVDFADNFEVFFDFPMENTGNTHVKPSGKITLKDSNGEILKGVGKEAVVNENGAVIGEKIVDYIPINDEGGNVLPLSERIFQSTWKGFPYKQTDIYGNTEIIYRSPSEYYSYINKQETPYLKAWERVSEVRTREIITSEIEISYVNESGEEIKFQSAQDFPVQYIEQKVSINPYAILIGFLATIFGIIFFLFKIARKKKRICKQCGIKTQKNWTTCPKCKSSL